MNRSVRRIFIDCTETCRGHGRAGIPRVVRNLVHAAPEIGREMGLECQGVAFDPAAGFVVVADIPNSAAPTGPWRRALSSVVKSSRSTAKECLTATRLLDPARRLTDFARSVKRRALAPLRRTSQTRLHFTAGDVLLLPDISWRTDFPWDEVQAARDAGAFIVAVVYDLIPIQYPPEVDTETHRLFCRWWNQVRDAAQYFICGSHSVMNDVVAADRSGISRMISHRVTSVHLGADLDGLVSGAEPARQLLIDAFRTATSRRAYLMVGMMSPRKNHALVLDAFERMWDDDIEVRLVIAGKCPANSQELQRRIGRHSEFGKRLFWFENVSDSELDYCYRQAAGLITASIAEGFNLPIVEALSRKCPVFASDLPVHREVGRAYAAFFPVADAASLAGLIRQHQQLGAIPGVESAEDLRWPDWSATCREMLRRAVDAAIDFETSRPLGTIARPAA
ncbi:MAG TPA: glycosyltransferase [Planctomycetaceae bacterium]